MVNQAWIFHFRHFFHLGSTQKINFGGKFKIFSTFKKALGDSRLYHAKWDQWCVTMLWPSLVTMSCDHVLWPVLSLWPALVTSILYVTTLQDLYNIKTCRFYYLTEMSICIILDHSAADIAISINDLRSHVMYHAMPDMLHHRGRWTFRFL